MPTLVACATDAWTVIDLRPLRDHLCTGIKTSPQMKQLIFAFDAALAIGGASKGTEEPRAPKLMEEIGKPMVNK